MEVCTEDMSRIASPFPSTDGLTSSPGLDISLNRLEWNSSVVEQPEILVELSGPENAASPSHKELFLVGVHGGSVTEDGDSYYGDDAGETKQFLAACNEDHKADSVSVHLELPDASGNSVLSGSSFTDSDVEVEPECSTHLLEKEESSPKQSKPPHCFQSSPTKPLIHHSSESHQKTDHYPTRVFFLHWNWPAIRLGCLVTFFSSMIAMTCVVVGMLLAGPLNCDPQREWWQGTVMYEIFPASFQDMDGDGFGDLRGILHRLDYVRDLSVEVVRMNSIFSALDYPLEYEHIIDFVNVDPHLGRMDDFDLLVKELHERNMFLLLDLNPTVTSDQHTWAAHWLLHRPGQYEDFYVNVTDSWEEPPLEYPDDYEQKDWAVPHRTFGSQLYLNWSNPAVKEEMNDVLEFWLKRGVDGFYMKHLEHLHVMEDQEVESIISDWRRILDKFSKNSHRKILVASHSFLEALKGRETPLERSVLHHFDLLDIRLAVGVNQTEDLKNQLLETDAWNSLSPRPWISWHVGSVETSRLATRLEETYALGAIFLLMMLPGSVTLFYGDEIGLQDSFDVFSRKVFRGGQLCPMQWTPQGNFTDDNSLPWLPPHPNFPHVNVENRTEIISLVSRLVALRNRSLAIAMNGELGEDPAEEGADRNAHLKSNYRVNRPNPGVLTLERFYSRRQRFLLCANFGEYVEKIDLSDTAFEGNVLLSSTAKKSGLLTFKYLAMEPGEVFISELTT